MCDSKTYYDWGFRFVQNCNVFTLRQCLGRRCVGYVNRHIFPGLSQEFQAAAALTSLPCALQIHMESLPSNFTQRRILTINMPIRSPSDPRWLSELLYEAFKESRRIVNAIQQSVAFFGGVSTGFVAPVFLLATVVFVPPYFRVGTCLIKR